MSPPDQAPKADEIAHRFLDLWQEQLTRLSQDSGWMETWQKLFLPFAQPLSGMTMPGFGGAGLSAPAGVADWMAVWQRTWSDALSRPGMAAGGRGAEHGRATTASGATTGPAPATAAPDDGGRRLDQLEIRLAELESRLASYERAAEPGPIATPRKTAGRSGLSGAAPGGAGTGPGRAGAGGGKGARRPR